MQVNRIDLTDRVAVITGGAQGIGLAIAERLLASGAKVAVWDVNREGMERAKAELAARPGSAVRAYRVDIADYASVEQAAERTVADFGRIDILVNNAAVVGPNAKVVEYPLDAWRDVIKVDVDGTFHCCRSVLPTMIAQNYGRIVNLASIAGKEGNPNAAAYSAAKAAVIALTIARQGSRSPRYRSELRDARGCANAGRDGAGARAHTVHAGEDPPRTLSGASRGGGDDRLARQ